MINFKKMDDKDFVFINQPLSKEEEKDFSAFLKVLKDRKKKRPSAKKNIANK